MRRTLLDVLVVAAGAQQEGKIAGIWQAPEEKCCQSAYRHSSASCGELGYIEGQNLVIEFRHADTQERFRALTTELKVVDFNWSTHGTG
jgi:hypothetical protein